jgi:hypothetical protein
MATFQGVPGRTYDVLSGRRYLADETTGLIQDVADNDRHDLFAAGCDPLPRGQNLSNLQSSPEARGKNRGGRRPKSAWHHVYMELIRIAELDGLKGRFKERGDCHKYVMEFCSRLEDPPNESAIRSLLQEVYDADWMR